MILGSQFDSQRASPIGSDSFAFERYLVVDAFTEERDYTSVQRRLARCDESERSDNESLQTRAYFELRRSGKT